MQYNINCHVGKRGAKLRQSGDLEKYAATRILHIKVAILSESYKNIDKLYNFVKM
jgi:hypothetical protein